MEHKEYRKLNTELYELNSAKEDQSAEIDYWARKIKESGEPALELGSGTGRVFIPLIERGFNIIGLDNSEDMTARLLAACKKKGLKAEVYEQNMLEFNLSNEFSLITLDSGGLGLFTKDEEIHSVFERVHSHLIPGGIFIYEFEEVTTKRAFTEFRDNWTGNWVKGADGVVMAWRRTGSNYNKETHVWEWLFIVEKFVNGRLIESEANERTGRLFTPEEAEQYARSAGFVDIVLTNRLTDDPPSEDFEGVGMTVQCRKPG